MVDEHRDLLAALQTRDRKLMLARLEKHIAVPVPAADPRNGRTVTRREGERPPPRGRPARDGAPRRHESSHRVPHPRRRDPRRRRRRLRDREGRHARRRGRVGQRQVGDGALDHAPDRCPGTDRARILDSSSTAATSRTLDEDEMATIRGNEISMIFQEPMTSLNPVFTSASRSPSRCASIRTSGQKEAADRALEMLRSSVSPRRSSGCATTPTRCPAGCGSA